MAPPVTVADLTGDPHPHLARLRAATPVAWIPELEGWLVTSRALAIEVMRDADRFTVDDPRFSTARVVGPSMLSLDGPEHERHRGAFAAPFRPAALRGDVVELVGGHTRRLVAGIEPSGRAELRSELAAPLAASVIGDFLELDAEPAAILGWYRAIVAAVEAITAGRPEAAPGGPGEMAAAVSAASATGAVLRAAASTDALTPAELVSNTAVVMFGAIETTEAMVANLLWHVLGDGELATRLRVEPDRRADAVEESLRLEPGAAVVDRYATGATSLGGVPIAAGDLVRVSLSAANRDPSVHREPDEFDLDRQEPAHLAFAQGPHLCLGMHLARIEAQAALDAVLLLPGVALDDAATVGPRGLVFRKAQAVVATWDSVRA